MLVLPDWVTILSRVVSPLDGGKSFYQMSQMTSDLPLPFSLSELRVDVVPGSPLIGSKPLPRLSSPVAIPQSPDILGRHASVTVPHPCAATRTSCPVKPMTGGFPRCVPLALKQLHPWGPVPGGWGPTGLVLAHTVMQLKHPVHPPPGRPRSLLPLQGVWLRQMEGAGCLSRSLFVRHLWVHWCNHSRGGH